MSFGMQHWITEQYDNENVFKTIPSVLGVNVEARNMFQLRSESLHRSYCIITGKYYCEDKIIIISLVD